MNAENQNIEFKESWRDEYLKCICGFANAQGGNLYVGIDDHGTICGVDNTHKLSEDIPNKIVSLLGIVAEVNILQKNNVEYIEIKVSPSNIPISFKGKYYVRSGSTMQELNGIALQHFILKKMGRSWDDIVNEYATINDIDRNAIDYFLNKGVKAGRIDEDEKLSSTTSVLENLGLINEKGQLKNAALLLFGKNPRRHFTCTEFKIGRFGQDEADLISQDLIEGNIIQMADRVMQVLKNKYLTMPIHYEGMQRIESLEVPEIALREILYNSICHKDYMGAPIQMRVWNDYVEIWNEGLLPEGYTPETLFVKHASHPRNKNLAFAFYKAGFIESWGRGYKKIREGFEAAGLPIPTIKTSEGGVLVTFQRNNVNLMKSKDCEKDDFLPQSLQKTKSKDSKGNVAEELTERQRIILDILQNVAVNVAVNTKYLSEQLHVNRKTIQRDLIYLQEKKLIQWIGSDKTGHWTLTKN